MDKLDRVSGAVNQDRADNIWALPKSTRRLSQCRGAAQPKPMCEKLWTLPPCFLRQTAKLRGIKIPTPPRPVDFWRRDRA
jgi:hypothetical protein